MKTGLVYNRGVNRKSGVQAWGEDPKVVDGVGKKNHLASKIPRLSPFFSIMIKNMAFLNFCQKKEGGGGIQTSY